MENSRELILEASMSIKHLNKLFAHEADGLNNTEIQAVDLVSTIALIVLFVAYKTLLDDRLHVQVLLERLLRLS
ncbi:hypothetical protein swp_1250 [Shewanella piezotolerans WP3]|uniref:Uncharacterized protein n=2 Tax=Shewanella TaxID=22 RepID=B8CKK5_SHEPW|nr:hypothetical protein swp_1250 [Shewanella piezotolerans WP3]